MNDNKDLIINNNPERAPHDKTELALNENTLSSSISGVTTMPSTMVDKEIVLIV